MEQSAWTDQRLNDRFDYLDNQLAEARKDIRDLRTEMTGVRGEMVELRNGLRAEMVELRNELRGEIGDLRSTMFRLHVTTLVVMVALFTAILARGG